MIGLCCGGEQCSLFPRQHPNYGSRTCRTSLDMCTEIDCIFLDDEARPFWRPAKPDCASVARVFVAVTLALFADDNCLTAANTRINTQPFETADARTITAGHIEGIGLLLQVFVINGRGPSNATLNIRQGGLEGRS